MRHPLLRTCGPARGVLPLCLVLCCAVGPDLAHAQGTPPDFGVIQAIRAVRADADGDGLPDREGDTVTVRGVALSATGELSAERFEIALDDGTAGIVLFAEGFATPVQRGDTVLAVGVVDSYRGQDQVRVDRYEVVGHGPPPVPISLDTVPDDLEALEGRLVRLTVLVGSPGTNNGGPYLSVTPQPDWRRPLLVFVRAQSATPAILAPFRTGDQLTVTGIFTQYDPAPPYRNGYQVMPRSRTDLVMPFFSRRVRDRLVYGVLGLMILLGAWVWVLRRQVRLQTEEVRHKEEERHRLELMLQERRRFETLGDLAGGIAHEFNNLLTTVMSNAGLLKEGEALSDDGRELVEGIERSAHGAEALTRRMLAFAGRTAPVLEEVAVEELVEREVARVLARAKPSIRVASSLEPVPPVRTDPVQLAEVFQSVVSNALDALGDREGSVRISTRRVEVQEGESLPLAGGDVLGKGVYVRVGVQDDGPGLHPDVAARVFDLYFTTKAHGQGLGLPAALGALRALGGGLSFASETGRGTRVDLYLPVASSGRTGEAEGDDGPGRGGSV